MTRQEIAYLERRIRVFQHHIWKLNDGAVNERALARKRELEHVLRAFTSEAGKRLGVE